MNPRSLFYVEKWPGVDFRWGSLFVVTGTQRCFNVDLGRDVEQLIFNVETTLLISTSGKQPIFNVVSTSKHNVETTSDFNVETTSDFKVETTSDFNVETTSYFNVETMSDFNAETTSYFNVETSDFNVETKPDFKRNNVRFQRWFIFTKSNVF